MDNLLTVVNNVCSIVGVPQLLTLVGNVDPRAITMLGLAKEELQELCRAKWWKDLTRFGTVNIVIGTASYNTPADFGKLVPSTIYGTTALPILGAVNPQQWADRQKYGSIYGVPGFRMIGSKIYFAPTPTINDTYAYEYKTKNRCTNAAGTLERETWGADDDLPLLDSYLIQLGIKWRYRYSKGLEYAEDYRVYGEAIEQTYGQELAHGIVTIGRNDAADRVLTMGYVPEQGYGA